MTIQWQRRYIYISTIKYRVHPYELKWLNLIWNKIHLNLTCNVINVYKDSFFYISILYISCYSGGPFAYTIFWCVYFLSRPTFKIRPKHRNTNFKVKKTEFKYQHAFKKKTYKKNKTKHTSFQIDNMIKIHSIRVWFILYSTSSCYKPNSRTQSKSRMNQDTHGTLDTRHSYNNRHIQQMYLRQHAMMQKQIMVS